MRVRHFMNSEGKVGFGWATKRFGFEVAPTNPNSVLELGVWLYFWVLYLRIRTSSCLAKVCIHNVLAKRFIYGINWLSFDNFDELGAIK